MKYLWTHRKNPETEILKIIDDPREVFKSGNYDERLDRFYQIGSEVKISISLDPATKYRSNSLRSRSASSHTPQIANDAVSVVKHKKPMEAWIQTTPDHDYKVTDVILCIDPGDSKVFQTWLKGFDDHEWEEAEAFAATVATTLGIEYIGVIGEAGISDED